MKYTPYEWYVTLGNASEDHPDQRGMLTSLIREVAPYLMAEALPPDLLARVERAAGACPPDPDPRPSLVRGRSKRTGS